MRRAFRSAIAMNDWGVTKAGRPEEGIGLPEEVGRSKGCEVHEVSEGGYL